MLQAALGTVLYNAALLAGLRRTGAKDVDTKVGEMLELVQLQQFAQRKPARSSVIAESSTTTWRRPVLCRSRLSATARTTTSPAISEIESTRSAVPRPPMRPMASAAK